MVASQLVARGIRNPAVLRAMGEVPRHRFLPGVALEDAYGDFPLPIGHGQTISQPYMVARMTELLEPAPEHRVLEVGSGSGYQSAVLARLVGRVHAMERLEALALRARSTLAALGVTGVEVRVGDGTRGWPEAAPFDRILVAAGAPAVPESLATQLAEGGRLVIPIGNRDFQTLHVVTRTGDELHAVLDTPCRFVDLIGHEGW
jgi:protein-L-isoaspartate(D-aspartate) O-methyltransferase